MGLVSVLLVERLALPPEARAALLVGFLGAFSSVSLETLALVEQGEWVNAGLNLLLSLVLCLFSCWAGILITRA